MFIIKIILFESVSVLFCVCHISFGARSYGKVVRLFKVAYYSFVRVQEVYTINVQI